MHSNNTYTKTYKTKPQKAFNGLVSNAKYAGKEWNRESIKTAYSMFKTF